MEGLGFSGAVRISPINDYISPSQQCVIPLMDKKTDRNVSVGVRVKPRSSKSKAVKIDPISETIPLQSESEGVKISLNDCLACSGCITTAESVLIQEQSHTVFRDISSKKLSGELEKVLVVSLSPQSLSSIANKHNLPLKDARSKLATYFKKLGVDYILDTNFSRNLSLMALAEELVELMERKNNPKQCNKSCGQDCSSTHLSLPLFASVCPGWVCYVEKSHGKLLIPHMSRVRSPQAISGSLIKSYLPKMMGLQEFYHISVMPCFDKKLEASRPDFLVPGTDERQVDCVVSTRELEIMMVEDEIDLKTVGSGNDDMYLFASIDADGNPLGHVGSGSGGYAQIMFTHVAARLFNTKTDDIQFKTVRNKDWKEMSLEVDGAIVLSAAVLNGFRHIQNLVQKMKKGNLKYDFVEVMACPSGCLNGGGQLAPTSAIDNAQFLAKVESLYKSSTCTSTHDWPHIQTTVADWLGDLTSADAKKHLFTEFHIVENSIAMKW